MPTTNGSMPEAEAEALLSEIRAIMAETELPFGPAVNIYIKEKQNARSGEAENN